METPKRTTPEIPIQIRKDIPLPENRFWPYSILSKLREALRKMSPGDSFLWKDYKAPYDAAKQLGFKILTRKVNGKGIRVWLVDKNGTPKNLRGKTIETHGSAKRQAESKKD